MYLARKTGNQPSIGSAQPVDMAVEPLGLYTQAKAIMAMHFKVQFALLLVDSILVRKFRLEKYPGVWLMEDPRAT